MTIYRDPSDDESTLSGGKNYFAEYSVRSLLRLLSLDKYNIKFSATVIAKLYTTPFDATASTNG